MALNLKKDDSTSQPDNGGEEKKSKFNLSKNEIPVTDNIEAADLPKGKSKLVVVLLLVILVVGGIWYQTQKSTSQNETLVSATTDTPTINNEVGDANQVLVDKLNYMINLLEDQQDEKTNNVTEEVVLYSFLGVFIIFVVDSFARVSKYVR